MYVDIEKNAGLYDIFTIPEEVNNGYASSLIYNIMKYAKNAGCERALLQSSKKALKIYERFGFEKFGSFVIANNVNFINSIKLKTKNL